MVVLDCVRRAVESERSCCRRCDCDGRPLPALADACMVSYCGVGGDSHSDITRAECRFGQRRHSEWKGEVTDAESLSVYRKSTEVTVRSVALRFPVAERPRLAPFDP